MSHPGSVHSLAYYPRTLLLPLHVGYSHPFTLLSVLWSCIGYILSVAGIERIFFWDLTIPKCPYSALPFDCGYVSLGFELETIFLQLWGHPPPIFLHALVINSNSSNSYWKWMDRKALPPQLGSWWLSLHSVWHGNTAISLENSKIHKCFLWGCPILTEKPCS